MFGTTLIAVSGMMMSAGIPPQTRVQQLGDVIEVRPQMLARDAHNRRDQTRFGVEDARGEVVAEVGQDGRVGWISTGANERARLGGENAPALIYVQVFDAVYAIDPFEPLPTPSKLAELWSEINQVTVRQLMRGSSMETDRTQYGRKPIERAKELFRALETSRVSWLKDNGFHGARTYGNPAAASTQTRGLPEPAGYFRIPADMPRGKSQEHVRISKPGFSAEEIGQAIARTESEDRDETQSDDAAVASRD